MPLRSARWWLLACLLTAVNVAGANRAWNFDVFLDDRPIGSFDLDLNEQANRIVATSTAQFKIKVLFVTVYTYSHRSVETWGNHCLEGLRSETDDNGKRYRIEATREGGATVVGTQVEGRNSTARLGECIMTFAYWDPALLEKTALLNAQDGRYVPITVTPKGDETLRVRGAAVASRHYALRGEELAIDLWYSPAGEWLALESTTPEGRKISYRLR
jgi:hypothetical protein